MNNVSCCSSCCSWGHGNCARKVSLFSSLCDSDIDKVLSLISRKSYLKGETIFSEGEVFDKLFIINSGSIKVYKYNKEGKEQIVYILKEGEFLGDLNLLKKDIFRFNASALENTSFCIIKKDDFDMLIKTNPDISIKVLEYAHDRISSLEELIQTLTTKDVEARLSALLLNLSKAFGIKVNNHIEINLPLSREDMANFIGVTRETISRKLSALQSEDIIEIVENRKVLIKDIECLKNYAGYTY